MKGKEENMKHFTKAALIALTILTTCSTVFAVDWPQFRGPTRDGQSPETGLMKKWPEGGPRELWSFEGLGKGYASVAVADGIVYTTGMVGKEGVLFAFDLEGNLKWKENYGLEWAGSLPGTRTTPTIDGDRLYLMSGQGRIDCRNAKTGKRIWHIDTPEKFQGKNIRWGIAESVLIENEKVICTPGGTDATVVALNKMTGETIWTTKGLSEKSAYCSPAVIDRGPNRIILTMVQQSIVGIDMNNGRVYWKHPNKVSYDISAVTPAYENGMMYVTNGYGHGGHMFKLSPDGTSSQRVWSEKSLDVHHGGVVLVDGKIHGASNKGNWTCLDLASGEVKYTGKLVGKGSVIYVDGMLYCYGERNGDVGLVKIKPDGYEMVSSFKITKGTKEHWGHPAISDGRLYMRHGDALMCYDIKDPKAEAAQILFDGTEESLMKNFKTASGKKKISDKVWIVKDGMLYNPRKGDRENENLGGSIVTKKQYANFDFYLEYKLDDDGKSTNSGIKYFAYPNTELGLEYQILSGNPKDNGTHESADLYDILPAKNTAQKPPGQWNSVRIVAVGDKAMHYFNGVKVLDYIRGGPEFRAGIAKSKFKDNKNFGEAPQGHILIQDHGGGIAFRNIKIRTLEN